MESGSPPPTPSTGRVKQRLIGLNIALLLMLGVVTILTSVDAGAHQPATTAAPRPRGEYTVVSGRYQGGTTNAIYVLDSANQELMALSWDKSRNELEVIGHRKLGDDAQLKPGR
jgi:hypothetical protein